ASYLAVPLKAGRRTVGVIEIYTHQPREFTREEVQLLSTFTRRARDAERMLEGACFPHLWAASSSGWRSLQSSGRSPPFTALATSSISQSGVEAPAVSPTTLLPNSQFDSISAAVSI